MTVAGSEEVCRERLDRALPPGSFEFRACDLVDLPYPDRTFDVVVSLRLLAHVERWRELVAELCRVASRAVILDYSDSRSFNQLYGPLFSWKKAVEGNTRTYQIFKPGEVAAEAARHGFGRPAERRQFFLPMVVHRALGSGGSASGRPIQPGAGRCSKRRASVVSATARAVVSFTPETLKSPCGPPLLA